MKRKQTFESNRTEKQLRIDDALEDPLDELRGFRISDVIHKTDMGDEEFIAWLQSLGLIAPKMKCVPTTNSVKGCNTMMTMRRKDSTWSFRCPKPGCRKEVGIKSGTFFEKSRITLQEIFKFSFFWARDIAKQDDLQIDFRRNDGSTLSTETIVDLKQYFRDICVGFLQSNDLRIGGPGQTVEIDETVLTKRKYNRGKLVDEQWFFGGIQRGTRDCFLVPVERRDAATLLPLIQKYILPGTTIVSDCWAAYRKIPDLPEGYTHLTVNHSENFVDPITGACTNAIESTWQDFKMRNKREYGTRRHMLADYMAQFVWRKKFGGKDPIWLIFATLG